eukprot:297223-Pleurochrysis_carterae.AAC.8
MSAEGKVQETVKRAAAEAHYMVSPRPLSALNCITVYWPTSSLFPSKHRDARSCHSLLFEVVYRPNKAVCTFDASSCVCAQKMTVPQLKAVLEANTQLKGGAKQVLDLFRPMD